MKRAAFRPAGKSTPFRASNFYAARCLPLQAIPQEATGLLDQYHLTGQGIAISLEPVEVYTGGYRFA